MLTVAPQPCSVLIGFAEAAAAPEVAWSLLDHGHTVTAFARRGRASALRHSRHVTCIDVRPPEADAQGCVADVASLLAASGRKIDALLPLDDAAVWVCSQQRRSANWTLLGPSNGTADLALDKELQIQAATRAGFDVPPTSVVRTTSELRAAVQTFPVIAKAAECAAIEDGRLRKSPSWICANREELERAVAAWGERVPLVVQPFITGVGEGVFGLATDEGVRAWSGHRRLRMMNPHGSGSSACVSQRVPDALKAKVEALIAQTGWRGLFMVELLCDEHGRRWFVELNGRSWGSMALSRQQGLEYPAWQVALLRDPGSLSLGTVEGGDGTVARHLGRDLIHLLFVLRGPRSKALSGWPSPWRALRDVTRIRLHDRLYNWRRNDPAVFFSDFYHTIHDNVFKARR
jgi:predicted ATP-grasp superfamily ATP-dependent carboligase